MIEGKIVYIRKEVDLYVSLASFIIGVAFLFQMEWLVGVLNLGISAAAAEVYVLKRWIDAQD